ncbi:MAG: peptide deformylase [Haliscomenobacter sp.]|uniref:peptide deformylase n=1 Tax=Haliscomenobacter sp. TaxID=2717303 RepID=UPI0029B5ADBA|nr:peptide deformylase [Haliscomenobacter sp.]MDX2071088.1 peptide deformylase [Haliscomenobacter sp.]
MLLPIYAYGQPVLRKKAEEITPDYPELSQFIANMWETMYHAEGVGLAAPQVGRAIRLFVIDTVQLEEKGKDVVGFKKVFINAQKVEEKGKIWAYEEGCLSIPDIRGDVDRLDTLTLRYMDENFEEHTETFNGINARVIQHEYDHTEGILFLEYLKPVKKAMIRGRLENIRKGKVKVDYKMKFA